VSFLTEALKEEEEEEEEEEDEASSFPAGCYERRRTNGQFGSFPCSQFNRLFDQSETNTLWSVCCSYYVWSVCVRSLQPETL